MASNDVYLRALTPEGMAPKDRGVLRVLAAGAMSGVSYWLVAFPMDAIKSVIQTSRGSSESIVDTARKLVAEGRLYRGLSVALVRGIPGASVTFATFRFAMDAMTPPPPAP
jgi:hypothetical protein